MLNDVHVAFIFRPVNTKYLGGLQNKITNNVAIRTF